MSVLDSLCMYRIEDWWTYELCYKKHVRQFHKEQDKVGHNPRIIDLHNMYVTKFVTYMDELCWLCNISTDV